MSNELTSTEELAVQFYVKFENGRFVREHGFGWGVICRTIDVGRYEFRMKEALDFKPIFCQIEITGKKAKETVPFVITTKCTCEGESHPDQVTVVPLQRYIGFIAIDDKRKLFRVKTMKHFWQHPANLKPRKAPRPATCDFFLAITSLVVAPPEVQAAIFRSQKSGGIHAPKA